VSRVWGGPRKPVSSPPMRAALLLFAVACVEEQAPPLLDCSDTPFIDECLPNEPVFAGPSDEIEVLRDTMGIPHVYAANDADAYYGSGYMQAFDRLFQMDLARRRALGTRAEIFGPDAVSDDIQVRTIGIGRWAEQSRRRELVEHPELYTLHLAWVAGVNRRIEEVRNGAAPLPPEFTELGYEPTPWTVGDAFAVGGLTLFGNADQIAYDGLATVVRDFLPDLEARLPLLAPARQTFTLPPEERPSMRSSPIVFDRPVARPEMPADLGQRLQSFLQTWRRLPMGASNNWAVAGVHTENGRPLIAGDPHQALRSPSLMWAHHMNSADRGGSLDTIGFNFVGTPSVQLGHNAHIAWTATTTYPDYIDMWAVKATNDTIDYGGETLPIVFREESIAVRGEAEPRIVHVEEIPSIPGVLMPRDFFPLPIAGSGRVLVRWVGFSAVESARSFHEIDVAQTLDAFDAAVDLNEIGAFNFVAADRSGITYRSSPRVPIRSEVTADRRPYTVLDGDDPSTLWTGEMLPLDRLPRSRGGERGWLATANNEPFGFLDDGTPIGDPYYFGVFFDPGTRAARIESELERLVARGDVGVDDMIALQDDTYTPFAEDFVPPLLEAWDGRAEDESLADFRDRADLDALVEGLRAWDRKMERTASDPVVFNAFMFFLARAVLSDDLGIVFGPILGDSPTFVMKLLSIVANDASAIGDSFFQEGRALLYVRALDETAAYLTAQFGGTEAERYRWADVHGTYFSSIHGPRLDGGFFATDGSLGTVNVSDTGFFDGDGNPRERLDSGGGAIFRIAVEFGEDGRPDAQVTIPRGVSGDPESPFWDNLHEDWIEGRAQRLHFDRADVEANLAERTMLAP
jgi:penicillin amidase